jgi:arylsulfatase A-like enzyme
MQSIGLRYGIALLVCAALTGCGGGVEDVGTIRLVQRFAEAGRIDEPLAPEPAPPVEWRFDGKKSAGAWSVGMAASAVREEDGLLRGRSQGPLPALVFTADEPAGVGDRLHEVWIRARVSAGTDLFVATASEDSVEPATIPMRLSGLSRANVLSTPILPGDEIHTYRLAVANAFIMGNLPLSNIRQVLVRPTDTAGAVFEIESVRLVFRSDYLAGVAAGIGWHGLSEVWRETLVSRAPTTLRWQLALPPRAWLDLTVGLIEDDPVTFEVRAEASGGTVEASKTVTVADRWEPFRVDFGDLSGGDITLSLTARGRDNKIAFWGSPVVRSSSPSDRLAGKEGAPSGVILIVADTLRKDHLQAYGYERENSPTLSRMAEDGVLFRDPVAQAPWTKASVPAILSSTYVSSHGVVDFTDRLPATAVTMAELFRDAGYATFATSSVAFSGQLTNLHQGVEVLHERVSVDQPAGVASSKTARTFVDRLIPWIEAHRDVPFFAFLHVFDPHSPFEPYPPYDTKWTEPWWRERYFREMDSTRPFIGHPLMRIFGMPERAAMEQAGVDIEPYLEHEKAWYDGSILAMDVEIARLLEVLARLGLSEDTLVVFTSDHGEEFLEHDRHFHGFGLYGEMTDVPLIMYWPGRIASRPVEQTVETVDILPTVAELAGLEIPETAQGDSLVPLFSTAPDGAEQRWRPRPAFSERITQPSMMTKDVVDSRAVVSDGWKLIHNTRAPGGWPEFELYDHQADPLNRVNVADKNPEAVERLRALLDSWQQQVIAEKLPDADEAESSLSAEELQQLRALGYIE